MLSLWKRNKSIPPLLRSNFTQSLADSAEQASIPSVSKASSPLRTAKTPQTRQITRKPPLPFSLSSCGEPALPSSFPWLPRSFRTAFPRSFYSHMKSCGGPAGVVKVSPKVHKSGFQAGGGGAGGGIALVRPNATSPSALLRTDASLSLILRAPAREREKEGERGRRKGKLREERGGYS